MGAAKKLFKSFARGIFMRVFAMDESQAATVEPIEAPANPCPPGARFLTLRASDGVELRAALWRPETVPRGTVALLQGRAEFIEKYYETVAELLSRGFVVAAFDWRGQGGSQRLLRNRAKGHVRRSTDYRLDLDALIGQLLTPECPKPWFALAHSMGAAAALDYAGAGGDAFSRLVGIAPMLALRGFPGSRLARGSASALRALGLGRLFVPGGGPESLAQRPFAKNILTGDPRRYARAAQILDADPALAIGDPTVGWVRQAYKLMDRLNSVDFAARIKTPALFVAAGGDRLVTTGAIERYARKLKVAECLVLPGARHEILMERDEIRAKFWAAFDAFMPGEPFLHEAATTAA
jgi:lysophospholipase